MAKKPQINYLNRDFQSIRTELETFLKAYFPDVWKDFNVASPGMALVDIVAYVGDLLSYIADKKYNENYLDGVTERKSVYRLAKTLGYKPPGFRPALTLVDVSIEVPTTAVGPDTDYLPIYRPGMKVKGAGQTFETTDQIDFGSDFSEDGTANRLIEPIFNSNQDLIRYRITKREKVKAGVTKIYSQEVTSTTPFLAITLPEKNVLEIISVIVINQLGITTVPTFQQFSDPTLRFYEVEFLAQNKIFIEDEETSRENGVASGIYLEVDRRFERQMLADGSCLIQFGNGTPNYNSYDDYLSDSAAFTSTKTLDSAKLLDNFALGQKIEANSTIFVKYRSGGGLNSNVGVGVLTEVSDIDAIILGSNPTLNQNVLNSTRATNVLSAVGGSGLSSVDEIKHQIAANFASQNRTVTLRDYVAKAYQIPGKFGVPFRIQGAVQDNKVILYIIARDGNGQLVTTSSNIIKNNIVKWLDQYRMINDFVEINDGKVINLQVETDLYIDKTFNVNEIKLNAINAIIDFMNVEKWEMGMNIYVSQIVDILREIPGVINVVDIRFYNMEGGLYSTTRTSQATINRTQVQGGGFRTQIELINNSILGLPLSMYELKFSAVDCAIRSN